MAQLPDIDEWREGDEENLSIIRDCYCPSCGGSNGLTTLLPTRVPFFKEIIVTNLHCDDCGFRSAEVNFGGEIQEKGERLTLQVTSSEDLNRQIIKSDSASLLIPKLDFEIPPGTQRGNVSTLEGVLRMAADNLEAAQPERLRLGDVDNFHRCRVAILNLRRFAGETRGENGNEDDDQTEVVPVFPFEIVLDDPAGNSYIENFLAPQLDPQLASVKYFRSANQDMSLGLQPSQQAIDAGRIDDSNPEHKNVVNAPKGKHTIQRTEDTPLGGVGRQEVIKFTTTCSNCYQPSETDMCVVDIPHFKEVIIMSMLCEACGFKSNEIKGGGGIPKFGTKISLSVVDPDDLAREVLKSDTAGIEIPELDFTLDEGGLDGVYTTIEGLLKAMRDRLESANPFGSGDSALKQHMTNDGGRFSDVSPNQARFLAFLEKLKDMSEGRMLPFTLVISDPLSNSFVGPVPKDAIALSYQAEKDGSNKCYEEYVDRGMQVDEYERSHDQNEYLGLNDIKTEGYSEGVANYGTDKMEEVPDRIRRVDVRGPDHPHQVGKAPVENDTTVMGPGSLNFAVPSVGLRGRTAARAIISELQPALVGRAAKLVRDFESNDDGFMMNENYDGSRTGMVYKDGAQGIGYYTNRPLHELWKEVVSNHVQSESNVT
jgi:zinc finger protein